MGQKDGHGHQFVGVAAGVAEHHALVARTLAVEHVAITGVGAELESGAHSLGDIRRLFVNGGDDPAGVGVEAVLGPRVADPGDGLPGDPGDVHIGVRGDLARHDDQTGGDQGLARHSAVGVVLQHRVEHGVGYLVGDLIGMALTHRLRREQEIMVLHKYLQNIYTKRPSPRVTGRPPV